MPRRKGPPAPPRLSTGDLIVAWCNQPRAMPAIVAQFGERSHNPSALVYNAVAAGKLVNLVDANVHGKRVGGVYVQTALRAQFGPQDPPPRPPPKRLRTRPPAALPTAAKVPPQAPAPTGATAPTKRRVSYHHHIPASPLAGGPQWSSLALVSVWEALPQPSQDDHHHA